MMGPVLWSRSVYMVSNLSQKGGGGILIGYGLVLTNMRKLRIAWISPDH